jgi:cytochrome c
MRTAAAGLTIVGLVLAGWGLLSPAGRGAAAEDDFGGLAEAPGREEVYYACDACHSIRLVTQQRLSRERWDQLLDWMVAEQGMAELTAEERRVILEYLATHYGPDVPRS